MRALTPVQADAVPTVLAQCQPDGAVRCGVCAHRCLVRVGRTGICGVRENRDGRLLSRAYGAVVAMGLDPIEKKPLFHVAPGSTAYSIATAGCPFHCTFCQNWEIAQGPRLGLELPSRHLPPAQVVDEATALDAGSIAYTYVEPTVFLEYALDVGRLAHQAGLRNLFITDGYATREAVRLLASVLDAANVDLKSFDDAFYRKLCGARLAPVLDSIVAMREAGIWLELTTLVIPGRNDDDRQLRALARWIVETLGPETPWHVSRFHPAFRLLDVPATPLPTLRRVAELGREAGLCHVYVGNAPELGLEDTHCAGCGRVVIERHGYTTRNRLTAQGTCVGCARPLAGLALAGAAAGPVSRIPCG
ncbi:MAG TPA: AmmeMemoRadiSam system radical SAM enzyme [Candidatus Sulfotelmatobacter sp.]|nr:AmmeMemoRadiSam system radical SAM enzyme [Candidatus Sulfotelmatobacter sp.]